MSRRKEFPRQVQDQVLINSRRRCALCFGLKGDLAVKPGQVAHIGDPKDSTLENAVFLCLEHHDEYDSKTSQAKALTPKELKWYRDQLYGFVEKDGAWINASGAPHKQRISKGHLIDVSLDVYDRRILTYRTTMQFIRTVTKDLNPSLNDIFQFSTDTDEAIFLFDDTIANYLAEIINRALRLHTLGWLRKRMENDPAPQNFLHVANEQATLFEWFSNQPQAVRARFIPFLRLSRSTGKKT